jgi:collagenase-like PrtC family protease
MLALLKIHSALCKALKERHDLDNTLGIRYLKQIMKLSLAANFDPELIPRLQHYPVEEVYGKFPTDCAGGGRPSYMGEPLSKRELASYIDLLTRHNIQFNYLLNTSCLGNREWSRSWQKKFIRLLENLGNMGIRRLTVSTPFILERIKARFPEFHLKVGIYAQVDTPRRAQFWENLGADAITLESFSINRNFKRLASIRKAVQCELQLIANHPCLLNCALQPYHQNGFAHASDGSGRLFIDYCFLSCSRKRLEDPSLFIKSAWIRPEDLAVYETLGYKTFKLLERNIPSEELLKRVEAYSNGRYSGNLAEILLPYGFKHTPTRGFLWILKYFIKPLQVNPGRIKALYDLIRSQGMLFPLSENPVRIDTNQIPDDFLDGFKNRDCISLDCRECGYCENIAVRAVRVDEAQRKKFLEQFNKIHKFILNGSLWGV